MEQTGQTPVSNEPSDCGPHSKRVKELENAALQTTLISQMEKDSGADPGSRVEQQRSGQGEQPSGLSLSHHRQARTEEEEEPELGTDTPAMQRGEEERTLTDHLNKRLLSSFLEKLNERDLALPGVQRLDCAVADEDSNRAAEEW